MVFNLPLEIYEYYLCRMQLHCICHCHRKNSTVHPSGTYADQPKNTYDMIILPTISMKRWLTKKC